MPSLSAKRILIYGVAGSGKTTLARRLSDATSIPWHSVDDLMWQPNWQMLPVEAQRERMLPICDGPEWILDTAYSGWREFVLSKADLVLALDFPRWISLSRLLRRTAARVFDRTPICNGNRESLRLALSRESIVLWHFRTFRNKRREIAKWEANSRGPSVLRFRSPREVERWLRELEGSPP